MANTKILLQFVHGQHSIHHLRSCRAVSQLVLPIVFSLVSIYSVLSISSSIYEYDNHIEHIQIGSNKTMSGLMGARTGNQTSKQMEDIIANDTFLDNMFRKINILVDIEETRNEIITTDDTIHNIPDGMNGKNDHTIDTPIAVKSDQNDKYSIFINR